MTTVAERQLDRAEVRPHTLEELLFWLPRVLARDWATEWERGFVKSVLGRAKRPSWRPTEKQVATMRRLVDQLLDPDTVLIEPDV